MARKVRVDAGGNGPEGYGILTSQDFNLIQHTNGCTLTGETAHNLIGLDPLLGVLMDNGSPTPTHALRVGSPAIEAGDCGGATNDQRGLIRSVDVPDLANVSNGCDIGAFELGVQICPSFVVNTNDDLDFGACTVGHCSLREAINAALSCGKGATIGFGSNVTGAVDLNGSLPALSSELTILGPGASVLSIRRSTGGEYGIFTIASNVTATITGLTISGGFFEEIAGYGGGVHNAGTLLIRGCVIQNHRAYYGVGIYNSGMLTVNDSVISGNHCTHDGEGGGIYNTESDSIELANAGIIGNVAGNDFSFGGGIYNAGGALRITKCEIIANSAMGQGAGGGVYNRTGGLVELRDTTVHANGAYAGGGLLNEGGSVTAERCTLSGNVAPEDDGGGIWNSGTLLLVNCTVSGNSSDFSGGGLYCAGTCNITNSTIAGNSAFDGGGISGTASVRNSIVAANATLTDGGVGPDFQGTLNSQDYNFIQRTSGCIILGATSHNILGKEPLLGPLAINGGPTMTHAPHLHDSKQRGERFQSFHPDSRRRYPSQFSNLPR